jgi:hypothetical protein
VADQPGSSAAEQSTTPKLFVRQSSGLVRNVSVTNALFFNVAAFVGVGLTLYPIFYSLADVNVWRAGPFSAYGWAAIIAGLFCILLAMIFASLTSVMPRSGGDYVFTSRIRHPFLGWTESWSRRPPAVFPRRGRLVSPGHLHRPVCHVPRARAGTPPRDRTDGVAGGRAAVDQAPDRRAQPKDAADTAMLLLGHELADHDGPGLLNSVYVAEVCGDDWGFYTTLADNLAKTHALLDDLLPDVDQRQVVVDRVGRLLAGLEAAPKTRGWRRRARIGRRMRWFETPDEATR